MEFSELNEKIRNHALTINALKSEISKVEFILGGADCE